MAGSKYDENGLPEQVPGLAGRGVNLMSCRGHYLLFDNDGKRVMELTTDQVRHLHMQLSIYMDTVDQRKRFIQDPSQLYN